MQFLGLFIEFCGKWKWWFKLQNPSHVNCGGKIYMQGMRVLSESEEISYQTPILKITKLIWRWKSENLKILAKILPKISFFSSKFRKYQLIIFLREPKLKKINLTLFVKHLCSLIQFNGLCWDLCGQYKKGIAIKIST